MSDKFLRPDFTSAPFSEGDAGHAIGLVVLRWQELTSPTFDISRRSRTLSFCAALEETIELAETWVRSQGETQPTKEARFAGHGIETLPQVAEEALALLRNSAVIKHLGAESALKVQTEEWLTFIAKNHKALSQPAVERCRALNALARTQFQATALLRLRQLIEKEPKKQLEILDLTEELVAELRSIGWTDEVMGNTIRELASEPSCDKALERLETTILTSPTKFACWVQVELGDLRLDKDYAHRGFDILLQDVPNVNLKAPLAKCVVAAPEPLAAARKAHLHAAAVMGTVDLFSTSEATVRGPKVVVQVEGTGPMLLELEKPTLRQRGGQVQQRLREALESAIAVARSSEDDAAFEAIRHARRAQTIDDDEIRFMVLWLGLERLLQGMGGYPTTLSSAREVIPKCLALAKLRREIGSLSATIGHLLPLLNENKQEQLLVAIGMGGTKISREKLLLAITGTETEYKLALDPVYDADPRIAMWTYRLRKALGTRGELQFGQKVVEYLEQSRQRTEWQVLRLYRARNRVAHAAKGPQWMADLVTHADFYLHQLVGIVTHGERREPAADTLAKRVGCFEAYLKFLRGHRDISASALLTPMTLFR